MYTKTIKLSKKIKALMNNNGIKQTTIAKGLRVSKQYVAHCININPKTGDFRRKDPYIREGIAKYLDVSYRELWGEPTPYYKKVVDDNKQVA